MAARLSGRFDADMEDGRVLRRSRRLAPYALQRDSESETEAEEDREYNRNKSRVILGVKAQDIVTTRKRFIYTDEHYRSMTRYCATNSLARNIKRPQVEAFLLQFNLTGYGTTIDDAIAKRIVNALEYHVISRLRNHVPISKVLDVDTMEVKWVAVYPDAWRVPGFDGNIGVPKNAPAGNVHAANVASSAANTNVATPGHPVNATTANAAAPVQFVDLTVTDTATPSRPVNTTSATAAAPVRFVDLTVTDTAAPARPVNTAPENAAPTVQSTNAATPGPPLATGPADAATPAQPLNTTSIPIPGTDLATTSTASQFAERVSDPVYLQKHPEITNWLLTSLQSAGIIQVFAPTTNAGGPVPVIHTPLPAAVVNTPAPVVSTPAPVVSTPAPVLNTPPPIAHTPAPVMRGAVPAPSTPLRPTRLSQSLLHTQPESLAQGSPASISKPGTGTGTGTDISVSPAGPSRYSLRQPRSFQSN